MESKKLAGRKAVDYIEEGMVVGLGTGTTVYHTIIRLGELVAEGLKITAVSTSNVTRELACSLSIPCIPLDEGMVIDLTIDGADEIDPAGNGIKGGGGALLYEKIVAINSKQNLWVVTDRKLVERLGRFPLPVEVIPFGYRLLFERFVNMGFNPVMRMRNGDVFRTDSNNMIIDLHLGEIDNPYELDRQLKAIPGVVDHGLFLEVVNMVIAGTESGIKFFDFR